MFSSAIVKQATSRAPISTQSSSEAGTRGAHGGKIERGGRERGGGQEEAGGGRRIGREIIFI